MKKAVYTKRLLVMHVVASGTHCSNDCPHMSIDAQSCRYFGIDLTWDDLKKQHGNLRPDECRRLEIPIPR
jgi:hypothetical protein